jgi:hypothetical protein
VGSQTDGSGKQEREGGDKVGYGYELIHLSLVPSAIFGTTNDPLPLSSEREYIAYKPEYEKTYNDLQQKWADAYEKGVFPDTVVMGAETYKQLVSVMFYRSKDPTPTFPEKFNGCKIVIVDGEGAEFVKNDIKSMLSIAYWNKKEIGR